MTMQYRARVAGFLSAVLLTGGGSTLSPVFAADAAAVKQCEDLTALSTADMKVAKATLVEQPLSTRQAQESAVGGPQINRANNDAGTSAIPSTQQTFCRIELTLMQIGRAHV